MSRIFQGDRGSISNITDKEIEKVICPDGIDKNSVSRINEIHLG